MCNLFILPDCHCDFYISKHIFDLFVHFPSKDSGQAIPRVVESCIRYINLYGKCII